MTDRRKWDMTYRAKHKTEIAVRAKAAYNRDPEPFIARRKRWRKAHPEKVRAAQQRYHERPETREKDRLRARKWYRANRARAYATAQKWKALHRDLVRAYDREYQRRRHGYYLPRICAAIACGAVIPRNLRHPHSNPMFCIRCRMAFGYIKGGYRDAA